MNKNPQNDEDKKTENSGISEENKMSENNIINEDKTLNSELLDNKTVDNNNKSENKQEDCKCCNNDCKCGDCNKCSDGVCCSINSNKKCCAKKLILILALTSCVLSVMALNKTNKFCSVKESDNIEERIKTEVKEVITKNPQLILDAISQGLVDKRDNLLKQSATNVEANKLDITRFAIRIGDANSKATAICFFDPTGTPCKEAQKIIANMIKTNKSICFYLVPVSILGEDSERITKIYYQLQELDKQKSSNKLEEFLQEISKEGATVDKVLDIIKVNKHELNKYSETSKAKMASNRELLEKLKISSLPAIFISKYKEKYEIVHDYTLLSKLV